MENYRHSRLAHSIIRELALAIAQDNLQDPRVHKLVTLYEGKLSKDMQRVTITVGGALSKRALHRSIAGLNSASGFLQRYLSTRLKLRRIPHLSFVMAPQIKGNANLVGKIEEHP